MTRKTTLNPRQLDLLRRIAEGGSPVTSREFGLATTVYALRNRNLVTTKRRNGIWTAEITETGTYYLRYGRRPGDIQGHARVRAKPLEKRASRPDRHLAMPPRELIERLNAAGGSIRITDPDQGERAAWRRAIRAARKEVPAGLRLWLKGRRRGDLVVRMGPLPQPKPKPSVVPTVPVPERLTHPHPVVAKLKAISSMKLTLDAWGRPASPSLDDLDRLDVSRQNLSRALRIMQALVTEAEARGWEVRAASTRNRRDVHLVIKSHHAYAVRIRERAGLLQLTLPDEYSGRRLWADGTRASVERKLGDVFANIDGRAAEAEERRLEQERRERERQRAWEQAMEVARVRFAEAYRAKVLRDEVASWRLAAEIRDYCAAARTAVTQGVGDGEAEEWLSWALAYADTIDPLQRPLAMPQSPDPKPDLLKPSLGRWSPYGPDSWQ